MVDVKRRIRFAGSAQRVISLHADGAGGHVSEAGDNVGALQCWIIDAIVRDGRVHIQGFATDEGDQIAFFGWAEEGPQIASDFGISTEHPLWGVAGVGPVDPLRVRDVRLSREHFHAQLLAEVLRVGFQQANRCARRPMIQLQTVRSTLRKSRAAAKVSSRLQAEVTGKVEQGPAQSDVRSTRLCSISTAFADAGTVF